MTEQWTTIPGFPGYEISSAGRIRSWLVHRGKPGPRFLAPSPDPKGYLATRLSDGTRMRTVKVHALVARAFFGPRPEGLEVRHLDGDNQNNTIENLEYGTPAENMADRVRHKTHCKSGHEFNAENSYPRPNGARSCRSCLHLADKRRRARERSEASA